MTELRLWPGLVLVSIQWLGMFVMPALAPDTKMYGVLGGFLFGVLIVVWWLFFSLVPRVERFGGLLFAVAAVFATNLVTHPSIADGMMGLMLTIHATPTLCMALVLWASLCGGWSTTSRRLGLAGLILLGCGVWLLVRTDGLAGDGTSHFAWRWTPTAEDRLLAESGDAPLTNTNAGTDVPATVLWSGFRGPNRDSVVRGVRIGADWANTAPSELWRRPVGPGWSSFAVADDRFYTQEQRGEEEMVTAYDLRTGEPLWRHADPIRFWESNAGAGPRATPTLHEGRIYSLGATGMLNVLDAQTGERLWSKLTTEDTLAEIPGWGFSGSPLVVDDLVVVDAGRLVAYDRTSGERRWLGPEVEGFSYSSPHLLTLDGVPQIVSTRSRGVDALAIDSGDLWWRHEWRGNRIIQPVLVDGDLLIGTERIGTRRLAVSQNGGEWQTEERWTSNGLKPYFSGMVVHNGHAYGFDGRIMSCIDVTDGARRWKGGRYGHGQLFLLADQDLLVVLTEKGELALVQALPDQFTEVARIPAIKGKTWNHPVLADDVLLVRNGKEMVAFQLQLEQGSSFGGR